MIYVSGLLALGFTYAIIRERLMLYTIQLAPGTIAQTLSSRW